MVLKEVEEEESLVMKFSVLSLIKSFNLALGKLYQPESRLIVGGLVQKALLWLADQTVPP